MPTLHIHLDESGDFNFKPTGSRYYIIAAAYTLHPFNVATSLTGLRFQLLKEGHNIPYFHASEDKQINRDAVVKIVSSHTDWNWIAVVVDKSCVSEPYRQPVKFYSEFASYTLRLILERKKDLCTKVIVFTDSLPISRRKESIEKAIRTVCRAVLSRRVPFCIYHHPSASNPWLQVADYCAWATARKWERNDQRTFNLLKTNLLKKEFLLPIRELG